jgi:hypothetical protein
VTSGADRSFYFEPGYGVSAIWLRALLGVFIWLLVVGFKHPFSGCLSVRRFKGLSGLNKIAGFCNREKVKEKVVFLDFFEKNLTSTSSTIIQSPSAI